MYLRVPRTKFRRFHKKGATIMSTNDNEEKEDIPVLTPWNKAHIVEGKLEFKLTWVAMDTELISNMARYPDETNTAKYGQMQYSPKTIKDSQ